MQMSIDKRLELITEAVIYARRVRELGMPSSCYSKAVREPIFFLWESYRIRKTHAARYVSVNAIGRSPGNGDIVYDHCVPFKIVLHNLIGLQEPSTMVVREILERLAVACFITKEEDQSLNKYGFKNKMPASWDGSNVTARYDAVGIMIVNNPRFHN